MNRTAEIANSSNSNDSRRTEIDFGYDDSVNINHGNVKGENATARVSKRDRKLRSMRWKCEAH
jgi:hypothetical protein